MNFFEFPLEIPEMRATWAILDEKMIGRYPNQERAYRNNIENKDVKETFKVAIELLNDLDSNIKS